MTYRMHRAQLILSAILLVTLTARAQTRTPSFLDDDTLFSSLFAGGGLSANSTSHPSAAHFGGSIGLETLSSHVGGFGAGTFLELGAMGPFPGRNAPAAFVSYDFSTNILLSRDSHVVPFAAAGYTYIFSQASALNFGIGADFHYQTYRAIRLEVRDYFTFTQVPQHNLALRLGWQFSVNNP